MTGNTCGIEHPLFKTVMLPYNFQTYRTALGNKSDGYVVLSEGIGHFCTAKTKELRQNNVLTRVKLRSPLC